MASLGPSWLAGVSSSARLFCGGRLLLQHFVSRPGAGGACLRVTLLLRAGAGASGADDGAGASGAGEDDDGAAAAGDGGSSSARFFSAEYFEGDVPALFAAAKGATAPNRPAAKFAVFLANGLAQVELNEKDVGDVAGGGSFRMNVVLARSGGLTVNLVLALEPKPSPHRDAVEAAFALAEALTAGAPAGAAEGAAVGAASAAAAAAAGAGEGEYAGAGAGTGAGQAAKRPR